MQKRNPIFFRINRTSNWQRISRRISLLADEKLENWLVQLHRRVSLVVKAARGIALAARKTCRQATGKFPSSFPHFPLGFSPTHCVILMKVHWSWLVSVLHPWLLMCYHPLSLVQYYVRSIKLQNTHPPPLSLLPSGFSPAFFAPAIFPFSAARATYMQLLL